MVNLLIHICYLNQMIHLYISTPMRVTITGSVLINHQQWMEYGCTKGSLVRYSNVDI